MALNHTGQTDQVLTTGRIAYGKDASGNFQPVSVSATGMVQVSGGSVTKTIETELMAATLIAASTVVASTVLSLTAGIKKVTIFINHGRAATAAFGTKGPNCFVQPRPKATGNDNGRSLVSSSPDSVAASSALSSGAVGAGTTVITILSGTAFAAGDLVIWANTTSAASIEWARVVSISGTASFTILDGVTNAQGSTQVIYNKAEHFVISVDAEPITRLRVALNNNASGTTNAIYSRIAAITES